MIFTEVILNLFSKSLDHNYQPSEGIGLHVFTFLSTLPSSFEFAKHGFYNASSIEQDKTTLSSIDETNVNRTTTRVQIYKTNSSQMLEQRQTPHMMALHIAEQLTMSTTHFVEFINLAHQWNLTGVEPVVYKSRMYALRSMHPGDINGSVYYHQILNTALMRDRLSECLRQYHGDVSRVNTSQLFVPLSVFLRQSVRKVVLVYFSKHMNVLGKEVQTAADVALNRATHKPIAECTDILRESGVSDNVEELLNQELLIEGANAINFTVDQGFCILPKFKLSLLKIREYFLNHIYHDRFNMINVSIVFISWQGKYTRPFTDIDSVHRCRLSANRITPSLQVISTSDQFLKSLGLQKQLYIAIHIRFEKLFEFAYDHHSHPRTFLRCCMLKLNAVLKQVKEHNNLTSEESTLLLHDYGHYGTDVCRYGNRDICVKHATHLLSLLQNESIKVEEFDPVKFGAPQSSGFVSRVEGLSLLSSRVLVAVGGGSYQGAVIKQFLERRKHDAFKTRSNSKPDRYKEALYYRLCAANERLYGVDFADCNK